MKKYILFIIFLVSTLLLVTLCACVDNETDQDAIRDNNIVSPKLFTVDYVTTEGGIISGVNKQTVEYGKDSEIVIAVPDTGYKFVEWSDGYKLERRYEKNVTSNITVTAIFEQIKCNVLYSTDGNGIIEGKAEQLIDFGGSSDIVSPVPNEGYRFVKWSDGLLKCDRNDDDVKTNLNVMAIFEKIIFTVNYSVIYGGTIEGDSEQLIKYGDDANFVIAIPENGYKFVKWSDGIGSPIRCDENIVSSLNLTAEFVFLYGDGDGSSELPFTIEAYSQLLDMWYYPNSNFKLVNNLDLSGISHDPIFDDLRMFTGKFDGNGKTISSLTVNTSVNFPSLFGFVGENGIISDLILTNVDIVSANYNTLLMGQSYCVGTLVGVSMGYIHDVTVSGKITVGRQDFDGVALGGLVGLAYGTVANCYLDIIFDLKNILREKPSSVDLPYLFGGMIGNCNSAYVKDCYVQGKILVAQSCADVIVGGLIGAYRLIQKADSYVQNCKTDMEIIGDSNYKVGGFIGHVDSINGSFLLISNCVSIGNLRSNFVAGFIYYIYSLGNLNLSNCKYEGNINCGTQIAGFLNEVNGMKDNVTVERCYAKSNVETAISGDGDHIGQASGFCFSAYKIKFINCYFIGKVIADYPAGFIYRLDYCTVNECFTESNIFAGTYGSGFIAQPTYSEIINCYALCNEISDNETESKPVYGISAHSSMLGTTMSNCYFTGNFSGAYIYRLSSSSNISKIYIIDYRNLSYDDLADHNNGKFDLSACFTIFNDADSLNCLVYNLNEGLKEPVWIKTEGLPQLKFMALNKCTCLNMKI